MMGLMSGAEVQHWWYSVVVSISGCDPLDPGSNPGTAITFFCRLCDVEAFFERIV